IIRIIWFTIRHPLLDTAAALLTVTWLKTGWPGETALVGSSAVGLIVLRLARPDWFTRLVAVPVQQRWRWWFYRRHWEAVMTLTGLAPEYRGRVVVPALGKVTVTGCTERVLVTMVSGQCPADFADRAEGIAHGFRAYLCRVRAAWPGALI